MSITVIISALVAMRGYHSRNQTCYNETHIILLAQPKHLLSIMQIHSGWNGTNRGLYDYDDGNLILLPISV